MARGNGQQAQAAMKSGKLSSFVTGGSKDGSEGKNAEYVDWKSLDTDLIGASVWATNKLDGSILFGHSRDKSCYSVVVFYGGEKKSYYFACSESGVSDLEAFLWSLIQLADLEA